MTVRARGERKQLEATQNRPATSDIRSGHFNFPGMGEKRTPAQVSLSEGSSNALLALPGLRGGGRKRGWQLALAETAPAQRPGPAAGTRCGNCLNSAGGDPGPLRLRRTPPGRRLAARPRAPGPVPARGAAGPAAPRRRAPVTPQGEGAAAKAAAGKQQQAARQALRPRRSGAAPAKAAQQQDMVAG